MTQTPLLMPTRRLRPHAVARSLVAVGVVAVMVVLAQATQLFTGVSRGHFAPRHPTLLLRAEEEAAPEMSEEEKAAAAQAAAIEAARAKMKRERQRIKMARNGVDLDGDNLDNLDLWYQEGILGKGGKPPKGFLRDVILRSFYGTWKETWVNTYGKKRSTQYTGAQAQPSETDYETAYENMKKFIKEKMHYAGKDDGMGWTWLVARQIPDGIFFYTMKSPPYGERPLALIKDSDPDEFFNKVDWQRIFIRLHKPQLWGGKAIVFPYPVGPIAQQRFIRADQVLPAKK